MNITRRQGNFLGFGICAVLMGYAYFAQYVQGYLPCPLCEFQRMAMIATGLMFLIAALHNPARVGARMYGVLAGLAASAGIAVAWRHVWLQGLPPDQVPACGPGLDYMLDTFPFTQVLKKVFTGSGECASIDWTFLGLSMPGWTLVWFVILAGWALFNAFRAGPSRVSRAAAVAG
ncbi:MAG: disulfide bond formation protein B [Pseudomonadota bacterium]